MMEDREGGGPTDLAEVESEPLLHPLDDYLNGTALAHMAKSNLSGKGGGDNLGWANFSSSQRVFLDKVRAGLEIVGIFNQDTELSKTDRRNNITWIHPLVVGHYLFWLEEKGCQGIREKVAGVCASIPMLRPAPVVSPQPLGSGPVLAAAGEAIEHNEEGSEMGEDDDTGDDKDDGITEAVRSVSAMEIDPDFKKALGGAMTLVTSFGKRNLKLQELNHGLHNQLHDSQAKTIELLEENLEDRKRKRSCHDEEVSEQDSWLTKMAKKCGGNLIGPLTRPSTRPSFKPFLVIDMDLTLMHQFPERAQAWTTDSFEAPAGEGKGLWELLPTLEEFLQNLSSSFVLCLLSASSLSTVKRFEQEVNRRMLGKGYITEGQSIFYKVGSCRHGVAYNDVSLKGFKMLDIPPELSIGLDDTSAAWELRDGGHIFPMLPFGDHHGKHETNNRHYNTALWIAELTTVLLGARELFLAEIGDKGAAFRDDLHVPTIAECLKRCADKCFVKLATPTMDRKR